MQSEAGTKLGFDPRLVVTLEAHRIGKDRVFVDPPEVNIGEGASQLSTVQWKNDTDEAAWLWMPNGEQYFNPPAKGNFPTPFKIDPGDKLELTVKDKPEKVRSQYHVYCESIGQYAEGNSPPVMNCP
jgi:hypothetical protein